MKKDNNEKYFGFKTQKGKLPKTDMGWEIFPEGLTHVINKFTENYSKSIPIYITENGMANNDKIKKGIINDQERISFYKKHLTEIRNLLKDGILLKGFFAWSLLDNFEWAFGYSKRFGLIYVDFKTQKRVPKNSWLEFKKNLKNN